jgi:hypothetical protein
MIVAALLTRCKTEATEHCCFDCCLSSQTIRSNLVDCGKLERDFEMMISRDFVASAAVVVAEAMKVSCVTFVVAVRGEVGLLQVASHFFGDNQPEALKKSSLNVFDLPEPWVWREASAVVMMKKKKRQATDSNLISAYEEHQWDVAE